MPRSRTPVVRMAPPLSSGTRDPERAARHAVSPERRRLGLAAEAAVRQWLERHGLVVLANNVRVGYLEVDLVVRDGRTLALVEVRTRSRTAWTSGFGSVDGWKRTRLRRAGERLWWRRYRFDARIDHIRFDVASVTFQGTEVTIEYVRAAF